MSTIQLHDNVPHLNVLHSPRPLTHRPSPVPYCYSTLTVLFLLDQRPHACLRQLPVPDNRAKAAFEGDRPSRSRGRAAERSTPGGEL